MLFIGDDWAEEHHDIEDGAGRRLARARLPVAPKGKPVRGHRRTSGHCRRPVSMADAHNRGTAPLTDSIRGQLSGSAQPPCVAKTRQSAALSTRQV